MRFVGDWNRNSFGCFIWRKSSTDCSDSFTRKSHLKLKFKDSWIVSLSFGCFVEEALSHY